MGSFCLWGQFVGLALTVVALRVAEAGEPHPAAVPAPVASGVAVPENYVSAVLHNGLRLSILPDPLAATVETQVFYHVGHVDEAKDELGLAHLFEHLMFGATNTYAKSEYLQFIYRYGGLANAFTASDETVFVSEVPPAQHEQLLRMEAERMLHLALTQADLATEKRVVSEELRMRQDNSPLGRVGVQLVHAALNGHPYDHTAGSPATLAPITLAQARAFYDRYYRPSNAHLIIVGPVDPGSTQAAVERYFGPLQAAASPAVRAPSLLEWPLPREVELKQDLLPGKAAALAYPLPPADSPDFWALQVLLQLLTENRCDVLREDLVRRQRVAFEAGLAALQLRRGGALVFWAGYLPYRRKPTAFRLLEQARDRISRLDWLTEATLGAAKRSLLRKEYARSYSLESRAHAIGTAHYWQGDERVAFAQAARLAAVTTAQVRDVYRRYVATRTPVRIYLKPEKVPWWLTLFGWLYPLVAR